MDITYPYERWPESLKSERFEKLFSIEDPDTLSEEERKVYDRWLKEYRDLQNCLDTAYEQGFLQQLAKNNSNKTFSEKQEIASEYLSQDFTIEQAAQATGLSLAEVKQLKKD